MVCLTAAGLLVHPALGLFAAGLCLGLLALNAAMAEIQAERSRQ